MGTAPASALRPLERSRLYEDLVERLADHVRQTGMGVGDRFPAERELAQRLEVSRSSVRQALVVLQAQGFVDIRHGGGAFLRRRRGFGESLPRLMERRRRLPEVLEAREGLEVKLAALAAQRRTAAGLATMHAALTAMQRDIAHGGLGIEGDLAFHHAVAEAAANRVLEHLIDEIADVVHESRVESLTEPGRPGRSLEAHHRILAAIEAGLPEAAASAMLRHLREVADVALLREEPPALRLGADRPPA
ncbi:MAG TPA: FadR/GntR family transcriptional regulator [Candidatus Micrarchaeia archaeon]|nr:FadR/GntR family transcriptional regulator [Candidatus Micrarchaeia archaeon]